MFSPLMCIYQEVVCMHKTWSPDHKFFFFLQEIISEFESRICNQRIWGREGSDVIFR